LSGEDLRETQVYMIICPKALDKIAGQKYNIYGWIHRSEKALGSHKSFERDPYL